MMAPLPRFLLPSDARQSSRNRSAKSSCTTARRTRTSGIIVEAEAYIGEDDGACHAACGPTARNAPLYGDPGRAYVYLNYGLHYLVNAVTEAQGQPAAMLLRALEPLEGTR